MSKIKVICLDLFGTLVEFKNGSTNSSIYYEIAKDFNLEINNFKRKALTINKSIFDILASEYQIFLEKEQIFYYQNKINNELNSIVYTKKGLDIINNIKMVGYKSAVCSNLAYPYAKFLSEFLSDKKIDEKFFSCEMECAKPDREIYDKICNKMNVDPENILFIGDSKSKDIDGSAAVGMYSKKIGFFSEENCFSDLLKYIKTIS